MTSSALASRYAGALVDVVTGPRAAAQPQQVSGELRSFQQALEGSSELHNALTSPAVAPSRKKAVVAKILARMGGSGITRNFLFVLIDHHRIAALADIVDAFEQLVDERLGFTRAEVTSARPLNETQQGAVLSQLERLTGKRVRPRFGVDEALIGGVVARIGSTVYDGSVRGQLESLGRRLASE